MQGLEVQGKVYTEECHWETKQFISDSVQREHLQVWRGEGSDLWQEMKKIKVVLQEWLCIVGALVTLQCRLAPVLLTILSSYIPAIIWQSIITNVRKPSMFMKAAMSCTVLTESLYRLCVLYNFKVKDRSSVGLVRNCAIWLEAEREAVPVKCVQ